MLHVKSCNVKHNSESVFCYFASAVNSNQSKKYKRKDLYAIILQSMKPSKSRLYSSAHLSQIVVWYTIQRLGLLYHLVQLITQTRQDSPCADSPDRDSGCGICLISAVSIIKRLSLYEFTLWGQDLVSVVRIRESPYYRESILQRFFFLQQIYENFVRTLETVSDREVSILERCPY